MSCQVLTGAMRACNDIELEWPWNLSCYSQSFWHRVAFL